MPGAGLLIDSEGLDKYLDPDRPALKRYWQGFGKDAVHYLSAVAYWEFLNGHHEHSALRKLLTKEITRKALEFKPLDRAQAEVAAKIYAALQGIIKDIPKNKKRERLEPLQCDVLIAATAHVHRLKVFTIDRQDWNHIRLAVQKFDSRPLEIEYASDL